MYIYIYIHMYKSSVVYISVYIYLYVYISIYPYKSESGGYRGAAGGGEREGAAAMVAGVVSCPGKFPNSESLLYMYVYIYICICICIYIYIYIYIYVYIHMYIYVYIEREGVEGNAAHAPHVALVRRRLRPRHLPHSDVLNTEVPPS